MGKTKIEWTATINADGTVTQGSTWNPIRAKLPDGRWGYHCEHASPGCQNCYAERMNKRKLPAWGTGLSYNVPNRNKVGMFIDYDELRKPLSWRKPKMIFCNSMTDLFADFMTDEMIDAEFAIMAMCWWHKFQVLTKRADRMERYFRDAAALRNRWFATLLDQRIFPGDPRRAVLCHGNQGPSRAGLAEGIAKGWRSLELPNVWLGVSVENQEWADKRITHLLRTPAAVRFLSVEPMLGPVDLGKYLEGHEEHGVDLARPIGSKVGCCTGWTPPVDWVIVGGESGPGARPFNVTWAWKIVEQCKAASVPCFVKQLGAKPYYTYLNPNCTSMDEDVYVDLKLKDRKGGDMAEWPEDLRVREFPEARNA